MTRKCARCDYEYDDIYDGCPACARAAASTAPAVNMPATAQGAGFAVGTETGYGAGNAMSAVVAVILVVLVGAGSALMVAEADAPEWFPLLTGPFWAFVIFLDRSIISGPLVPGFRITGTAGTSRAIWGLVTLLIPVVGVPMYFYQRPRIRRAFEIGYRPNAEGWHRDPTRRHESRYWSGSSWTAHVADDGVVASDPMQ